MINKAEADRKAGRVVRIEQVLPGDPDWRLVQARRREPLADFEAYHRKRRKKSGHRSAR